MKIQFLRYFALILSVIGQVFLFSACKEDEEFQPNPLSAQITVGYGIFSQAYLGASFTLSGSGSVDANRQPFEYIWGMTKRPAGSTALLPSNRQAEITFTPDLPGVYEFTLTVFRGAISDSKSVEVNVQTPPFQFITQDITSDRVLENIVFSGQPDYIVTEDIRVTARLSIRPGVRIAFLEGKSMKIDQGGSLVAKGTAEDKIAFTGTVNTTGNWKGVQIASADINNLLEHTMFFGVGSGFWPDVPIKAAVYLAPGSHLSVVQSSISNNAGTGIYADASTQFGAFEGNIFQNNQGGLLHIQTHHVALLSANEIGNGSTGDFIGVHGKEFSGEVGTVWQPQGVPYRLMDGLEIRNGLEIAAGTRLQFLTQGLLEIKPNAYLKAIGTANNPISFTAVDTAQTGNWRGLLIGSGSANNQLDHVQIGNAGYSEGGTGGSIVLPSGSNAQLSLKNSLIFRCARHAVWVGNDAQFTESGNTFRAVAQEPIFRE